jgi:hypothetical protein
MSNRLPIATTEFSATASRRIVIELKPIGQLFDRISTAAVRKRRECSTWNTTPFGSNQNESWPYPQSCIVFHAEHSALPTHSN